MKFDASLKPPKKSDLNKSWMKKKPDRAIKIHPDNELPIEWTYPLIQPKLIEEAQKRGIC